VINSRKVISVRTPLNQTYLGAQLLQQINFDKMIMIVISFCFFSIEIISYLTYVSYRKKYSHKFKNDWNNELVIIS